MPPPSIQQKVAIYATFENVQINVQNAICAGDFKTRFFAFFNFTVTKISTINKNCDCNFFIDRSAAIRPF
jgi:hypothetical protein